MHLTGTLSRFALRLLLGGMLWASSSAIAAPPPGPNTTLEHAFTLFVDGKPRAEEEKEETFKARREKTNEEVLRRVLRRYNTLGVRDLKGIQNLTSGSLAMSMRARYSPQFIQAVALGEGRVSVRAMRNQDILWDAFSDITGVELPAGILVVDTKDHGLVLESADPAVLQKFVAQIFLPQGSLHLVRAPEQGIWRTVWLDQEMLDHDVVKRVTLGQSSHTGAMFGQITFTEHGVEQWQAMLREADRTLVLALDSEPIAIVHRPEHGTMIAPGSEKVSALTFSCHATWVGPGDVEECTALAAARASSYIPLRLVLNGARVSP